MGINSDRQKELDKRGMYGDYASKNKKKKIEKSYNDLSIIENYNQKMNMLAPGSLLSKIIGIIIVVGLVLYFCNIYIGFWIVIAGIIMYAGLAIALKVQKNKEKKEKQD